MTYEKPTSFFTDPEFLNNMILILRGLMILGEIEFDGKRYAIGSDTRQRGEHDFAVCVVAKSYDTETDKESETLIRVPDSFYFLCEMAAKLSTEDYIKIAADVGFNIERYQSQR